MASATRERRRAMARAGPGQRRPAIQAESGRIPIPSSPPCGCEDVSSGGAAVVRMTGLARPEEFVCFAVSFWDLSQSRFVSRSVFGSEHATVLFLFSRATV